MRFQVPQFIDVEDHIFGPFTFRQFIYLGGGIGLTFVALRLFPKPFGYIAAIPILAFAAALAFYKVNNRPFIQLIESAFKYFVGARMYIWKHRETKQDLSAEALVQKYTKISVPKMSDSKLGELSWKVGTLSGETQTKTEE